MPASTQQRLELGKRDHALLQTLASVRFLRFEHIHDIFYPGTAHQWPSERLGKLTRFGFLQKLAMPVLLTDNESNLSRSNVFTLGEAGQTFAQSQLGFPESVVSWNANPESPATYFKLTHDLETVGFLAALIVASRRSGKFTVESWRSQFDMEHATVTLPEDYQKRTPIPDLLVTLKVGTRTEHFCYERDRSSMNNGKMLAKAKRYVQARNLNIYKSLFGVRNFRVLIHTTSAKRATNIMRLYQEEYDGKYARMFWFTPVADGDGTSGALTPEQVEDYVWMNNGDTKRHSIVE